MKFNVEEMQLMACFDYSSREAAMTDIRVLLAFKITDEEETEMCRRMLEKLEAMSESEFSQYDFSAYEDTD